MTEHSIAPTRAELDEALHASGVLPAHVAVARADPRPIGAGQLAESFQVALDYHGSPAGPASAFVKLPPLEEHSAATASRIGAFEREIYFYTELRPALRINAPRFLGTLQRPDGSVGLVLEDLSVAARPLDQLRDGTVAQACSVARQLAGLQAPYWDDETRVGGSARFYNRTDDHIDGLADRYLESWATVGQRIRAAFERSHVTILERFGTRVRGWAAGITGPRTLVHQDLRLDNLLWDGHRAWLIDWQTLAWTSPAWDLAFFLGTALEPSVRRQVEGQLLAEHVAALRRHGVVGWDYGTAWREHRRLSGSVLLSMVAALAFVKPTDRGYDMFAHLLRRGAQQAIDHDLLSFT